jgi:flagellar basal-body rod modification protein FlgD
MASTTAAQAANIPAQFTTSSSAPLKSTAEQQKTQFLRLLVAQLQGQNPLDPKDGTEFVSQLAQFSSLEELINIRTTLETLANKPATGEAASSNPFQGA